MASGACVTVVAAVHGTTVPTNAAADQVIVTTASATGAWKTVADTSAGGLALTYTPSTHSFGTIAVPASLNFAEPETPSRNDQRLERNLHARSYSEPIGELELFRE